MVGAFVINHTTIPFPLVFGLVRIDLMILRRMLQTSHLLRFSPTFLASTALRFEGPFV